MSQHKIKIFTAWKGSICWIHVKEKRNQGNTCWYAFSELRAGFALCGDKQNILHLHTHIKKHNMHTCTHAQIRRAVVAALEGFTNHGPSGIYHSCPDMTSRSITVTVTVTLLHTSAPLQFMHTHTHTHPPTHQSCDAYIFTPPHYGYHYVWLYLLPSH